MCDMRTVPIAEWLSIGSKATKLWFYFLALSKKRYKSYNSGWSLSKGT